MESAGRPWVKKVGGFLGWRMVAIAFLAQNMAYGLSFGIYGTFVLPLSETFGAPRALAASGLGGVMLTGGVLGPFIAYAVGRWSIRSIMTCGVLLMSIGYALVAVSPGILPLLASFALCVGLGVALLGYLPSNTLITRWFFARRGMALGIAVMPVFISFMPIVAGTLTAEYGWRLTAAGMGLLVLPLLLAVRLVIDRPADVGQFPLGLQLGFPETGAASAQGKGMPTAALLRDGRFWLLFLASGLTISGSSMLVTHIIPMAIDAGISRQQAPLLLSALGASGIFGAVLFGALGDRIGFAYALMLGAGMQALLWSGFLGTRDFPVHLALAVGIGLCSGGQSPVHAALVSKVFGPASYAKAASFSGMATVPFLFAAPLFAGYLVDSTGSYRPAIQLHIAAFILGGFAYFLAGRGRTSN